MNRSTPRAFLKTLDAPTLVKHMRKYIQRSLVMDSIESHLFEEAVERLEAQEGIWINGEVSHTLESELGGDHDQQR